MQKILFLAVFTLLLSVEAPAQAKNDTLDYFSLPADHRKEWDDLFDNWEKNHFNAFLKRQKIKLSCAHCERVHIYVLFHVFDEHAHFKILSNKKCGDSFTKKQLKEIEMLLMKIVFP